MAQRSRTATSDGQRRLATSGTTLVLSLLAWGLAAAGCVQAPSRPTLENGGGTGDTGGASASTGGNTGGGDPKPSGPAGTTGSSSATGGQSGTGGTSSGSDTGGTTGGAGGSGGSGAGGSAMNNTGGSGAGGSGAGGSGAGTGTGGSGGVGGTGGATTSGGAGGTAGSGAAPSGAAWGRADLCGDYCKCMGSGQCTGKAPANCMATCQSSAGNWNIPCRLEKCQSANKDYSDQISGSCSTAAGMQGCWNKDALSKAM